MFLINKYFLNDYLCNIGLKCKLYKSVHFILKFALFLITRIVHDSTMSSYSVPTLSKLSKRKLGKVKA